MPHRIAEGVAHLLDKSPADRALFMLISMILGFVQYLGWLLYFSVFPHPLISADVLHVMIQVMIITIGVLTILYGFGRKHREHPATHRWLPIMMAQLYSATLLPIGYVLGQLSFTTGILLAGSPIVGFILFDQRYVWWALGSALLLFLVVGILTVLGVVPYAPLIAFNLENDRYLGFHFLTQLYFGSPHLVAFIVIANIVMQRWKWRENDIRVQSELDGLTGAFNRKAIFHRLHGLSVDPHAAPVSVLMLDLDHFKSVNDRYGHGFGDQVLQSVVHSLQESLRQNDYLGRYGGEEFLVVLPRTPLKRAVEVAERCRVTVEQLRLEYQGQSLSFSISIGVASGDLGVLEYPEQLVHQADQALYQAKRTGRNRVCAAPQGSSTAISGGGAGAAPAKAPD